MRDGEITIRKVENDIASCNVCMAHNYEPSIGMSVGRKVDTLYDISFGGGNGSLIVRVCADCLKKLRGEIDDTFYRIGNREE